jgi:hypothetical protein
MGHRLRKNPKSEIRNPQSETNPNRGKGEKWKIAGKNPIHSPSAMNVPLPFSPFSTFFPLEFVSDFGFRISDFCSYRPTFSSYSYRPHTLPIMHAAARIEDYLLADFQAVQDLSFRPA